MKITALHPSTPLVADALAYAAAEAANDTTGHDVAHIHRVFTTTQYLARRENADLQTAELIAALHDVADFKFTGDENSGARAALRWLLLQNAPTALAETVAHNIGGISYKGANTPTRPLTVEGEVVQDADRLDAIGAIGIARCFAYGGAKGRPIHDPDVPVMLHSTTEQYLAHEGTSINHFYEKTLLLKDRLNTASAREIAESRHAVVENFLAQFDAEWESRMHTHITVRLPPMSFKDIHKDLPGEMVMVLPGHASVHCDDQHTVMEMILGLQDQTTVEAATDAAVQAWALYSNQPPTIDVTTAVKWVGENPQDMEAAAALGLHLPTVRLWTTRPSGHS